MTVEAAPVAEALPASEPVSPHPVGPRLDHGAVGNGRVLALIAPDTRIEWLCMPRFDSPSVFGRLLDIEKGGEFAFFPAGEGAVTRMRYLPNTNVLHTVVEADDGSFEVFDFAPRIPSGLGCHDPPELHRLVIPRSGRPRVRIRFDPRPDYARCKPDIAPTGRGVEVCGGPVRLYLNTNVASSTLINGLPTLLDRTWYFALSCGRPPEADSTAAVQHALDLTVAGWKSWAKACALPRFAPEAVLRSALCLKLHAFTDTGAIIAATTTSIPEAVGTERTWDYRFCWLRDAAFTVEGLRRLSQLAEGEAFVRYLRDVAESGPLQPVYGIGGERELHEERLEHLAGYGNSRPVRIGNAAYLQRQNDLMGEMVLCLETLMTDPRLAAEDQSSLMRLVERMVTDAIEAAPTLDTGIWEFRTLLKRYTLSQVMCWVAGHRGARLARRHGLKETADRWQAWADEHHRNVMAEAYSESLGFFTQALHGQYPDASNLLLPTVGFVDPRDPRFVSTVRAYERLLVERGLMLRYKNPDDFGDTTSAFSICSFWWCEALAMMGELERAVDVFHRVLSYANPVGLFSEDIDPTTGRLVGNFPQAYTHVGLIHAAITIGELLEARDSKFRAWT
jgi:GH15 family glucan-1,4-alpha-glucosidase